VGSQGPTSFVRILVHVTAYSKKMEVQTIPDEIKPLHNGTMNAGNEVTFPSLEDMERELPHIDDGQVHLGLVMHQVVQDLYAQLLNVAET
jgi:hypothetical protein